VENKRYFLLVGILAFISLVGVTCSIYSENSPIAALTSVSVTQPPTDVPTQTAIPTSIPLRPIFPTSPTAMPPYPTASVVKTNAVAFIAENALWVANVDGSGERKLTDIQNNESWTSSYLLKWSPDGKWISFISGNNLWVISPDGSTSRKVIEVSEADNKNKIWSYSWSPEGSEIAYIQTIKGKPIPRLLNLGTGDVSDLPISTDQLSLSWSPDGRYILLNTYTSLTIFEASTGKVLKEIKLDCPVWRGGLTWSPNSEWAYHPAYAGSGEYSMGVCVNGRDGSNSDAHINSSSRLPVWDKTGNFLYFTARATNTSSIMEANHRLLRYDVRTHETKQILSLEPGIWSVSISPNGHVLEMDSTISENRQLFIFLDLTSLSTTRFEISAIPDSARFDDITVWSADNQNLILLSGEFYRLNSQTGKTTIFSGKHSVEYWAVSPIATSP
jgi:Tol biopolymer transport system component